MEGLEMVLLGVCPDDFPVDACTVEFDISQEYDEFILDWMADIYTFMQWKYNVPSKEIVGKIPPEELYQKFSPLHEASLENGVDKLWDVYWASP